jgi:alpha-beta hydrolase superfamily lysophospholipase
MIRRLQAPLLLVALGACASTAAAQQERAVFLARIGTDTLAVETMTRTGRSADAAIRYHTPATRVEQSVRVSADAVVEYIRTTIRQGARADSVTQRAELTLAGDSARSHSDGGAGTPPSPDRTIAVPAGAIPFLHLSGLSLELILRRARALGGDSALVPVLVTGATRNVVASVVRLAGGDSALVTIAGVTLRSRTDATGHFLGASVPAQDLVIERLAGNSRVAEWTGAAPVASYAAPPGAPYTAEDVVIAAKAGHLAGTLTVPRHARGTRVPAVLLVSGSGPQDRDEGTPSLERWRPFREIADTLSRRGIAVLRLDDRGVGGSAAAAAGVTMLDEAADVREALGWLRARPEIDGARVGLVGHSSGAAVAPMVAASDNRLRALVLIAPPASTGRAISEFQIRSIFSEDTTLAPARRDSLLGVALRQADSAFAGAGWLHQFGAYDPLPTARRVRTATLVLHGETDRQVPVADARALAQAMRDAGHRTVTLRTFPRLNHLLVDDPSGSTLHYDTLPDLHVRADLRGVLADWLVLALGSRSPTP